MCVCFICMHVCAPHVYLGPAEVRRGHQIPLDLELWVVVWFLGIEPRSPERTLSALYQ